MNTPRPAPLLIAASIASPEMFRNAITPIFEKGGLSAFLGAKDLDGMNIIDVGCGDMRYSESLYQAGASEVVAVEQHEAYLERGKKAGWFSGMVLCANVLDLAKDPEQRQRYDCATVMNLAPDIGGSNTINPVLLAAHALIHSRGQIITTLVEPRRTFDVAKDMQQLFKHVEFSRVWRSHKNQVAHNVMIVGTEKVSLD